MSFDACRSCRISMNAVPAPDIVQKLGSGDLVRDGVLEGVVKTAVHRVLTATNGSLYQELQEKTHLSPSGKLLVAQAQKQPWREHAQDPMPLMSHTLLLVFPTPAAAL